MRRQIQPKSRARLRTLGLSLVAAGGAGVFVAAPGTARAFGPFGAFGANQTDEKAYHRSLAEYGSKDYRAALAQLERAKKAGKPLTADELNLRGGIYLHMHLYDKAREDFRAAAGKDRHLWVAKYNLGEVDFQEGHYARSREQFEALLAETSRRRQPREWQFLQYKIQVGYLREGSTEHALRFLSETRREDAPALYAYLSAAVDYQRGEAKEAHHWLAEANASAPAPLERVFNQSFHNLGWRGSSSSGLAADGERGIEGRAEILKPRNEPIEMPSPDVASEPQATPAPTVAVVQLIPGNDAAAGAVEPSGSGAVPAPSGKGKPVVVEPPIPLPGPTPQTESSPASATSAPAPQPSPDLPKFHETASANSGTPAAASSPAAATSPTPAPPAPETPNAAFSEKYEAAFLKYSQKDYAGALRLLDEADVAQPGLADTYNLRGLIYSRQHQFDQAEPMFRKAVAIDPTFWAAKFNLAELPFNYRNYGEARNRFEALFAETDPATQPREAELTQFKIFLSLLLEGKESAAKPFMQRFKFSSATPARYFSEAALDFHDGNFNRAIDWMTTAKKEYPAQLVAIFVESFYRIGWLTEPLAAAAPAAASPSPSPSPETSPAPAETPAVAAATPSVNPFASVERPGAQAPDSADGHSALSLNAPAASPSELPIAPTPPPLPGLPSAASLPSGGVPAASSAPGVSPGAVASAPVSPPPESSASPSLSPPPANAGALVRFARVALPGGVLLYLIGTWAFVIRVLLNRRAEKSRQIKMALRRSADKMAAETRV